MIGELDASDAKEGFNPLPHLLMHPRCCGKDREHVLAVAYWSFAVSVFQKILSHAYNRGHKALHSEHGPFITCFRPQSATSIQNELGLSEVLCK